MTTNVLLVNYGAGNMASIRRALDSISLPFIEVVDAPSATVNTDIFIIPGVGSFADASKALRSRGFNREYFINKKVIGICLGMQLLCSDSTEDGYSPGLSLITASVLPIAEHPQFRTGYRLPHVGWQELVFDKSSFTDKLGLVQGSDVYFVHSFMAQISNPSDLIASVDFHAIPVPAVISSGQSVGFQFHPEKSGDVGLNILKSTIKYLA